MMTTASNWQTSASDRNSPKTSIVGGAAAPVEMEAGRKRSRAPLLRGETIIVNHRRSLLLLFDYGFTHLWDDHATRGNVSRNDRAVGREAARARARVE